MRASVRFSGRARRAANDISKWWRENRSAAPALFDVELAAVVEILGANPEIGVRYNERKNRLIRRFLLRETRFHIYYFYDPKKADVLIVAVWNAVRGKGPKL
ncbi:MAG: hypothetical protein AB1405_05945 [Bdellovibrionota bacterium]